MNKTNIKVERNAVDKKKIIMTVEECHFEKVECMNVLNE